MAKDNSKFVPRSSLGKAFDFIYEVQEQLVDGTWRAVTPTNDRQVALAKLATIEHRGGVGRHGGRSETICKPPR